MSFSTLAYFDLIPLFRPLLILGSHVHQQRPAYLAKMSQNPDTLQYLFGRVFGDPSHCTCCIWVGCSNSVSKETRNNATILLKVQQRSKMDTTQRILSTASKYMLCQKCRRDKGRTIKCARDLMNKLLFYANRVDNITSCLSTQYWPTSMCQNAANWLPELHYPTELDARGLPVQNTTN